MQGLLSQLVILDSKDRATGTASDYTYNMGSYGPDNVYGYRVNKVSIPFSWETIITQDWNILYNSVQYTITTFGGQYNVFQLVAEIQRGLNYALGAGQITFVFNNDGTQTFTFQCVSALNTMVLQFDENNLGIYQYKSVGISTGFRTAENITIPTPLASYIFYSPFAINLSGPPNIYIKSQALQIYTSSWFNMNADNVIQSIPVNVQAGNYIIWQNSVQTDFAQAPSKSASSWDMKIVDEYNNLVDLQGLDWTIEIQIYYKY